VSQPVNETTIVYDYHVIVPHVSRPAIALLFQDDLWYLPHWEETGRRLWQSVDHVNRAVREHFDLGATTLRCMGTEYDSALGRVERVYEMENRTSAWSPPVRGRWVTRDTIGGLPFGIPAHRVLVEQWLSDAEQLTPPQRRPWARRGWLDATTNWIRDQLRHMGIMFVSIEQQRTWERSCLLRVQTDAGNLYFKAVPSMFAHEPPLTQRLAEWLPGRFPTILKLDDHQHWMLMADFGGQSLEHAHDITQWEAAMRRFAEIQIGLVLRKDELLALGCPSRPLDGFPEHIDALLDDNAALLVDKPGGLTRAEAAGLRTRRAEFHTTARELIAFDLPLSLEHGDLWAGNIVMTGSDFLFFDWSDSSLTHPFFSLSLFLQDAADAFPEIPNIRDRLSEAYLAPWALYRPMDELRSAFAAAMTLGPLHHAIAYHRYILPQMRARWEMERMIPFYIGMLAPFPPAPPEPIVEYSEPISVVKALPEVSPAPDAVSETLGTAAPSIEAEAD